MTVRILSAQDNTELTVSQQVAPMISELRDSVIQATARPGPAARAPFVPRSLVQASCKLRASFVQASREIAQKPAADCGGRPAATPAGGAERRSRWHGPLQGC